MQVILDNLSLAQREAVTHRDGPLLILAGPGSGKTRVVTHRVAWLLSQGVSASSIVALTFTNKAADEMRTRLERLAPGSNVWIGTFHRFGAQFLRQYASRVGLKENFSILDARDSLALVGDVIRELGLDDAMSSPDAVARAISAAKSEGLTPEAYLPDRYDPMGQKMLQVYPAYARRLLAANAVDFDDLLMHVVTCLREDPELRARLDDRYRYLLVDEYQDTNLTQYSIARALSIDHPNLAVTGDPDQSIYGWRGANLNNILEFEHDFPSVRVVRLEQNYRSTKAIVHSAQTLIENNQQRKEKGLFTDNDAGQPVRVVEYVDQRDEADGIVLSILEQIARGDRSPGDFVILYRTNWLSRVLEESLRSHRLPFQIVHGVEFYGRQEVRDLLAYLQVLNNPDNDIALKRIINNPPRGIGKTTIDRLETYALQHRVPLWEACRRGGTIQGVPARSAVQVAKFIAMLDRLRLQITQSVASLVSEVLEQSGYGEALQQSKDPQAEERLQNLNELISAARDFEQSSTEDPTLERYLEQAALVNDTDDLQAGNRVTLMTLHAAKGLEFPVVYIVGLEEGLLPMKPRDQESDRTEEERRLLFVGMTRARQELYLSLAQHRVQRGMFRPTVPSSFLMELPREEVEFLRQGEGTAEFGRRKSEFGDAYEGEGVHDYDEEPTFDIHDDGPREAREPMPQRSTGPLGRSNRPARSASSLPAMLTAADFMRRAGESPASDAGAGPQSSFKMGTVVSHPEYGTGTVVAVDGEGDRCRATVRFFGNPRLRQFVVAKSPLVAVQSE